MKKLVLITVFVFTIILLQAQTFNFLPFKAFDAGYSSHMLVEGDFNNDGLIDIATANYTGDNISVLLGITQDSLGNEVLYTAGDGCFDIATADFNDDGNLDLVATNVTDDNISVFIGNGDGTFNTQMNYIAGNAPKGVVCGYFNNDSIIDIVVANDYADNISIFIGIGNGTFNAKVDYAGGDRPHGILSYDLDGDTCLDIITMNRNDHDICVMKGNGDGSFQTPIWFDVERYPQFATLGFFNADTLIDLAVANTFDCDSISILLGDSFTIFKPATNIYVEGIPYGLAAADYDLDGFVDIAATMNDIDSLYIIAGNGDGTFQAPEKYLAGSDPRGIISVDIDQDSDIDLYSVNYSGGGYTYLYINGTCPEIAITKEDLSIIGGNDGSATAIVTGGVKPYLYQWDDPLAQTDSTADNLLGGIYTVTVYDSQGCTTIAEVEILDPICFLDVGLTFTHTSSIGATDGEAIATIVSGVSPYTFQWNDPLMQSDSIADNLPKGNYQVIVTDSLGCIDTSYVSILELPCINEYKTYQNLSSSDVEIAYINNDSILDIVTLHSGTTDAISVMFGNGDGTFTFNNSFSFGISGDQPVDLIVDEFNGDSINDIIVAVPDGVNGICIFIGNGDGTFQPKVDLFIGSRPWHLVSHDYDFDGDNDLFICRDQAHDVRLMKNNGSASFFWDGSRSVGANPKHLVAGFLNNDSLIDLVTVNSNQASISVCLAYSSTSFSSTNYLAGIDPEQACLGDFNQDTILDIAVTTQSPDNVNVYIGKGDGTFYDKVEYPSGTNPRSLQALDMNGDSLLDLAIFNSSDSTLQVLLGFGDGTFDSTVTMNLGYSPYETAKADIDRDGDEDMVVCLSGADSLSIISNCLFEKCVFLYPDSTVAADENRNNGYASIIAAGMHQPFTFQWNDSQGQTTIYADSLYAGTYQVIVTDTLGCSDSLEITIEEIPCEIDTHHVYNSICDGDSLLFGSTYYSTVGIYYDTLTNIVLCDSIRILHLDLRMNTTSSTTDTVCESYTVPSGNQTYFTSGIYHDTIPNYEMCDSIITINLTVADIDTSVTLVADTLEAMQMGASYQWLDCDLAYAIIPGATSQTYIPAISGNFAVEISLYMCKDTSSCKQVVFTGIGASEDNVNIYPNPTSNSFTVEAEFIKSVIITNTEGMLIMEKEINSNTAHINMGSYAKAIYYVKVYTSKGIVVRKLLLQ
jgi:FG-GAP-like repeat/Secretion system C-terminal sorting domain/SprB repeat